MKGKRFLLSLLAAFLVGLLVSAGYFYSGPYYERISKESQQLRWEIEIRRAAESKLKEEISLLRTILQETKAELAEKTRLVERLTTKIPGGTKRKPAAFVEGGYHEVQPGDTLAGIAGQYGISVDELCRLNDITPEQVIYPGEKLLVSPSRHQ